MDATNQRLIDATMIALDGTENKAKLGANAILAVSMAVRARRGECAAAAALPLSRRRERVRAAGADDEHPQRRSARRQQRRLPGVHGRCRWARRPSRDALRWGAEVFHTLKGVLKKKGYNTAVGDEGGFAPT